MCETPRADGWRHTRHGTAPIMSISTEQIGRFELHVSGPRRTSRVRTKTPRSSFLTPPLGRERKKSLADPIDASSLLPRCPRVSFWTRGRTVSRDRSRPERRETGRPPKRVAKMQPGPSPVVLGEFGGHHLLAPSQARSWARVSIVADVELQQRRWDPDRFGGLS
jgi:hypothetical protein